MSSSFIWSVAAADVNNGTLVLWWPVVCSIFACSNATIGNWKSNQNGNVPQFNYVHAVNEDIVWYIYTEWVYMMLLLNWSQDQALFIFAQSTWLLMMPTAVWRLVQNNYSFGCKWFAFFILFYKIFFQKYMKGIIMHWFENPSLMKDVLLLPFLHLAYCTQ